MRVLSATECITPAIDRTKAILFKPFRKGRTWKLAATAYLTRVGTIFVPFPIVYLFFLPAIRAAGSVAVAAFIGVILLIIALFVLFFYVCSRLEFAYFDIVLNRGEFVAPAWRKYGHQSLRWSAIKIGMGTVVTLACALPIAAYIKRLGPLFQTMASLKPGQQPPPEFITALFAGYGIILLVFGSFYLVSSLLYDFIVPSLALEDTTISEAFRRMIALFQSEPGEVAIYVLLKVGLGFAAYTGAIIVFEIFLFISAAILAIIAGGIGYMLHLAGIPTAILTALAILLAIVWYLVIVVYCMLLTIGTVLTFLDAYLLYFLGGRYPLLGDLLERSEPPRIEFTQPPGFGTPYPPPPPITG